MPLERAKEELKWVQQKNAQKDEMFQKVQTRLDEETVENRSDCLAEMSQRFRIRLQESTESSADCLTETF